MLPDFQQTFAFICSELSVKNIAEFGSLADILVLSPCKMNIKEPEVMNSLELLTKIYNTKLLMRLIKT
jgi:hypothetical protein